MKRKSLNVVGKILTSLFLLVYSFTPSVMAIDDLYTIDNSQDILDGGVSDPEWITNGSTSVTSDVVVLNKVYVAPQDSDVTVTFTKLPSNPSTLSIKQITLTREEVDATGAVSNTAYDINTSMVDGTFEYDLTLPSNSDDTKVVYAENRSELLKNAQEVNNTVVDQGDTVKIEDLNHFTIFIATGSNAPKLSTALVEGQTSITVPPSMNITVTVNVTTSGSGTANDWKRTGYQIEGSTLQCVNTGSHSDTGTNEESFSITAPSTIGTYDLTLWAYNASSCTGTVGTTISNPLVMTDAITVKNGNLTLTPPTLENDPLDTYALSSVTGTWISMTGGTNYQGLNTNEIRWGIPAESTKSGLKFTNSGAQSFNEGDAFYLGMLTHMNWKTSSGAATSATLQIALDFARPDIPNPIFTYSFNIEETSNSWYHCPAYQESGTPCDDKVTFPNSFGTQTFTIGDIQYTLVIDGFVNSFPSGSAVSAFITEEQKDNNAFLVGHLSSVLVERPQILLTKKTNGLDISSVANAQSLYVGDPVTWQYIVQNSGNTALTNITVTDSPSETISCPKTTLAAGEVMTCTASGTVQSGLFSNTATARGNHTTGSVQATDSSFYIGSIYCGDGIKNGTEQCDGTDGLPNSEFKCTNTCTLELVEAKVTVCHASDSQANPYVTNKPNKSADVSGHDGHNGPIWYSGITTSWGDIIPPFYYIGGHYDGKNWTTEGQAIWNNGCSIPQGKLIVQKTTLPSGDTTVFNITVSGTGTILNSASGTITDTTDYEYTVTPGTYSVNENALSGWGQTSNTCTNVTVANGETKYCTIENKKLPVLTIEKVLNGASVPLNTFSFIVDGWSTMPFEADGNNNIFVIPGVVYTITETNPGANYNVTYSTGCSGTLDYAQTATCTITNTEYGTLTIVKDANPHSSQSFDFTTGAGLSAFSLTDDGSVFGSNTKTFTNLLPGTYSVTENPLSGWDLSNVTCSDGSLNTSINLSAGENITCTFTNLMRGAIGGHKYNDADGDYSTTSDRAGVLGWTIYIDTNTNGSLDAGELSTLTDLNGSYGFTNLIPGIYQLREVLSVGWYKIYPSSDYINVTLDPGEQDYHNDFINASYGSISVYKNVDTDGDGTVDITNSSDWKWDIDGNGDYATGTTQGNLRAGVYTISEENTAGYHVSNLVCKGNTISPVTTSTDVVINSGENAVCTFTNTRDTGTVHVVKNLITNNGGILTNSSFSFNLRDASGAILKTIQFEADGTNDISLPTGTYSIDEILNSGYTTSHDGCSAINVTYGGEATCTITNDDKPGTLVVQKNLTKDNGGNENPQDFSFTVNGTQYQFEPDGENAISVNAGVYNILETPSAGYTPSYGECSGVSIANGETKTCVISNNDIAPTITLIKNVDNGHGGNATINDFGLTIGGTAVTSGQTLSVAANTPIIINEAGLPGYQFVSITGDKCPSGLRGTTTLNEGENIVCTITNDDIQPTLTVVKTVVNNTNDRNLAANNFVMTVDGTDVSNSSFAGSATGTTVGLDAGSYSVSETYDNTKYTQELSEGCSETIALGENKLCTITNTDINNIPTMDVEKSANTSTVPENGGDVTYTFTVENTGDEPVSITSLTDNQFGTLEGDSDCHIGTSLAGYTECTFEITRTLSGDAGTTHTNTFTATVIDDEGTPVSDSDDEIVTFTDVLPSITVNKVASTNEIPETGGDVTYTFTVTNNTVEAVVINSLSDDVLGKHIGDSDCYEGMTLAGNNSCTFDKVYTIPAGVAPATHTNIFTATVYDNEENPASDSDDETVTLTYVPTLKLVKTVVNQFGSEATAGMWDLTATGDEYSFTAKGDEGQYHVVTPGQAYVLSEDGPAGFSVSQWSCDKEGVLEEDAITLAAEDDVTCTITNTAQPGTINIYKDVVNSELIGKDIYTGTIFNVHLGDSLDRALTDVKQISDSGPDSSLVASFTNLSSAEEYTVFEDPADGYSFGGCYAMVPQGETITRLISLPNTFSVPNGETLNVVCENIIIDPILELTKSNNTGGADMLAGQNVVYTLTVTAPTREELPKPTLRATLFELADEDEYTEKYVVKDVKVVDLPPEGFKYESGSWTATSSVRGDLKLQGITPEPQYHSPGAWYLGDMLEGEVVTLTYTANISDAQDAGDYEDLALARGYFLDGGKVFANQNAGIFVDTSVNVTEDIQEGQVLGVTDYEYPDTGAKTVITIAAIASAILGALLLLIKPKRKSKVLAISAVLVLGGVALLTPAKAYADTSDIAVRIEQPETPYNKSNFKIGFVALDISERELQIQCVETTHGVFQTSTIKAGGNSGDCVVDSSVVSGTGSYEFYIIASAGSDTSTSDKVKVAIDLNGPSPVVNYAKTTPETCKYTLSFTTANDAGQTSGVQIFRSTSRTFTANSSTLVTELPAISAQAITYTDTLPVCNTEYFYAIRAVDAANNTSTFVTDAQVVVIPPAVTPVVEELNPAGTEEVQGETTTEEETQSGTDTSGEVQGETTTDEDTVKEYTFWSWFKYVLIGIGVASLCGVAYIYVTNRRKTTKAV